AGGRRSRVALDGAHPVRADDPLLGVRRRLRDVPLEPSAPAQPPRLRVGSVPASEHGPLLSLDRGRRPQVRRARHARAARVDASRQRRARGGGAVVRPSPYRAWTILAAGALSAAAGSACRGQTSDDPPLVLERNMFDTERYNPES